MNIDMNMILNIALTPTDWFLLLSYAAGAIWTFGAITACIDQMRQNDIQRLGIAAYERQNNMRHGIEQVLRLVCTIFPTAWIFIVLLAWRAQAGWKLSLTVREQALRINRLDTWRSATTSRSVMYGLSLQERRGNTWGKRTAWA